MRSIVVGFDCNNSCGFCAQGALRQRIATRPIDELKIEVAQTAQRGGSVALVGGEPTLSDDLPSLIAWARASGFSRVLLQTNGRRLSEPGLLASYIDAGLTGLDVSLHGATAAMHEFHTQTASSFRETVLGLTEAKRLGLPVGVTIVITRSNYRNLADIVRLARDLGARAVNLSVARALGSARQSAPPLVPVREMVDPYLIAVVKAANAERMGVVVDGRTNDARWLEYFAGIGATES
ncbi:MAG: radical SAM protein [Polyangiaceae bacterium]